MEILNTLFGISIVKKLMTKKEDYDRMARFGCILCSYLGYEGTLSEIHHIRRTSQRKNSPSIPLCREHHRGDTGIHGLGRKRFESTYDITEEELIDIANESIGYHWDKIADGIMMGSRIQ